MNKTIRIAMFFSLFFYTCISSHGQVLTQKQQDELLNGIMEIQSQYQSDSEKQVEKKQISHDLKMTIEDIEKEKKKIFDNKYWSSEEEGFALTKILQKPQVEKIDFMKGKIKRYIWSQIDENTQTCFIYKVGIGIPLKFNFSKLSKNDQLDVLKASVVVSGKACNGKVLSAKVANYGINKPCIFWTSSYIYEEVTWKRIASTLAHRNKLFLISLTYPIKSKGKPLQKFNWFWTQLKLF